MPHNQRNPPRPPRRDRNMPPYQILPPLQRRQGAHETTLAPDQIRAEPGSEVDVLEGPLNSSNRGDGSE